MQAYEILALLGISSVKQQFLSMNTPGSLDLKTDANGGRLRPHFTVISECFENSFDGTGVFRRASPQ